MELHSTTLLGMVDASIGGKTAINSKYGKNLVEHFTYLKIYGLTLFFKNTRLKSLIVDLGDHQIWND